VVYLSFLCFSPYCCVSGGAGIQGLWPTSLSPPKLTYVRGQNIIEDAHINDKLTGSNFGTAKFAVLCGEYVVPMEAGRFRMIGATHEHQECMLHAPPDHIHAISLLEPKVKKFMSSTPSSFTFMNPDKVVCGVRVLSERTQFGKLPKVGNIRDNVWVITGMGSRGLLHHIYVGKILIEATMESNRKKEIIPKQFLL
jgi:glycine/D-amino acid oxidase-like deaminating enzyme